MIRTLARLSLICSATAVIAGCGRVQGGSTTSPDAARVPADATLDQVPLGAPPGQPVTIAAGIRNPFDGDPAAVEEGKTLFGSMNCVYCHGAEASGLMGPPLDGASWRYGGSPAEIYKSIHDGRPQGMPAWGGRLPPDEIWKLVAYLRSLQNGSVASTTGEQPADQSKSDAAHQGLLAAQKPSSR
jgi:cytochrome c oxidase cbb3-type subunit 3